MRLLNSLFIAILVSVFRAIFGLGRRLVNYVARNPHARRAAGWGCLIVLALWLGGMLLSGLSNALDWALSELRAGQGLPVLVLGGIACLVGVLGYLFAARPAWRTRVTLLWKRLKARLGGGGAQAWEEEPVAEDDLLDRIVIVEDEEG